MVGSKSGRVSPRARCAALWWLAAAATTSFDDDDEDVVVRALIDGRMSFSVTVFVLMGIRSLQSRLREQLFDDRPERERRNEGERTDDHDDADEHPHEERRI